MKLNLAHTNRNPGDFEVEDYEKKIERGDTKALRQLREDTDADLLRWQTWLKTPEGRAAMTLADPEIKRLEAHISMSSKELAERGIVLSERNLFGKIVGVQEHVVSEYKNQCIGALNVWKWIKFRPEQLKSLASDLDKQLGEKEGGDKKKGWRKQS